MTPLRNLSEEEAEALNRLYPKRQAAPGDPVYRLEGEYLQSSISVQSQKSDEFHTIGEVVIKPPGDILPFIQETNLAEITGIEHKEGAMVISLNNQFYATEESKVRTALKEGTPYTPAKAGTGASFSLGIGRKATEDEGYWLRKDYRFLSVLAVLLLLTAAYLIEATEIRTFLAIGAGVLFFLQLIPVAPSFLKGKKSFDLVQLSGPLRIQDKGYFLDRFVLDLPRNWKEGLTSGQSIEVEGYRVTENHLKVCTLGLQKVAQLPVVSNRAKKDRWLTLGIISLVNMVLLYPLGGFFAKIETFSQYQTTKDRPSEFSGYKELKKAELLEGQLVHLTDMYTLPNVTTDGYFEGYYITHPSPWEADWNPLEKHLLAIYEVQLTREMLELYAYSLEDQYDYLYFLQNYYPQDEDPLTMGQYRESFLHNGYFPVIEETYQALLAFGEDNTVEDPLPLTSDSPLLEYFRNQGQENPSYRNLIMAMDRMWTNFFYAEAEHLREVYNRVVEEAYKKTEYLPIGIPGVEPLFMSWDLRDLLRFSSGRSGLDNPVEENTPLTAQRNLKSFQGEIQNSQVLRNLPLGTISQEQNLKLIPGNPYEDLKGLTLDLLMGGLFLLSFGLALIGFYKPTIFTSS